MKNYNIVIVYQNGLSRSTNQKGETKVEAIQSALDTDTDAEKIINLTVVEKVREDY